jgi:hypothetical protein
MLMVLLLSRNESWQGGGGSTCVGGGKDKALVRRFLEEVSKGNLNVIDELLAPDFVDRSFERLWPSTAKNDRWYLTPRGALLFRWGGLGAGGRYHPPYRGAFRQTKLNFREYGF